MSTMTIREAARRLGVHENTVRRYVDRGLIRAERLPSGVRRPRREDVEAMVPEDNGEFEREPTTDEIFSQPVAPYDEEGHAAAIREHFTPGDLEEWARWIQEQRKRDR